MEFIFPTDWQFLLGTLLNWEFISLLLIWFCAFSVPIIYRAKGDLLAVYVAIFIVSCFGIFSGWLTVRGKVVPKQVWQNLEYGSIDRILIEESSLVDKTLVDTAFLPIKQEFVKALAGCYGFNYDPRRIFRQSTRSNVVRFKDRNGILAPQILKIADAGFGAGLGAVTPQICKNIQKADPMDCQAVGYFWCPEIAKLMDHLLK